MTLPERVRRALDRRRSGAAGPHKQKPRNADWLSEYEAGVDCLEPGELHFEKRIFEPSGENLLN